MSIGKQSAVHFEEIDDVNQFSSNMAISSSALLAIF